MSFAHALYELGLRLAAGLSPLVARGESKVARGLRGRLRDRETFREWARDGRAAERPLAWFHAPSVGEGLQARAILTALRDRRPDLQVAYTHFSPSAEALAARMPADVAGYLPWDTRAQAAAALDALRPDLLAFTKTEVWPGLTAAATRRGVPVVLTAATLPEGAGRLRLRSRWFLRPTFASLACVLAISEEDGARFRALGVPPERIRVTGDPAMDSAWRRAREADPEAPYLQPFHRSARPTVVAGSTWGPDEDVLLAALERMGGARPRLVIAPHEPGADHLARLEAAIDRTGLCHVRLAEVEARGEVGEADVVVVDRVGVLAHLYTVGTVAYVGGGFHRHGLHSVLEPAAAGLPVVFGPRHANARAAGELVRCGGGLSVLDAEGVARTLRAWLTGPSEREEASGSASGYIEVHRGAAGRTAEALDDLLPPPGRAT